VLIMMKMWKLLNLLYSSGRFYQEKDCTVEGCFKSSFSLDVGKNAFRPGVVDLWNSLLGERVLLNKCFKVIGLVYVVGFSPSNHTILPVRVLVYMHVYILR
jgi:hypothetical protein